MKIFGTISELVKVAFRLSGGKEVRLEVSATQSGSGPVVVTIPNVGSNAANLVTTGDSGTVTSTMIADGTIVNADINAAAAIDASKIADGTVSSTEFQYLGNVTSDIQTQINSKQATITGAATTITTSDLTASKALQSDASGKVAASSVTSTELGYVSGVTSSIQTQINSKQATITGAATTITSSDLTASRAVVSDGSGKVAVSTVTSTELGYLSGATSSVQTQLNSKAAKGANSDITSLSGLTTPLSAGQGGTGLSALGTGVATFLGTPSSANLASAVTDETGSGSLVFGTSPTLSSPQVNSSIVVQQIATPSNPSAGFNKIYTKSDGILYKLDSSGNEVAVGSSAGGSGEVNAVLNPSAATDTTGWAAATNYIVSKDSANSPLAPAVSTAFAMSTTTASAESSTSGISYAGFTMPAALQNKKLKVEFFANIPATSTGVWRLSLYDSTNTRVALSTDSSSITTLPGGVNGKFVAYFDATSSATYSLRLTQTTRTSANTLYITNVIVGPGIQPQGAVVGFAVSFTPTGSWTTNTTYTGFYRRVGDWMEGQIMLSFSGAPNATTLTVNLPSGLTVNTTALTSQTNSNMRLGDLQLLNSGTAKYLGHLVYSSTTALLARYEFNNGAVNTDAGSVNATTPYTVKSGDEFQMTFRVPIAEWAGAGTVQLAQNDVEYAWSTDGTTTAGATQTDNGLYGYGPSGTSFVSVDSNTANNQTRKRVRFQTPIQPGDVFTIEINRGDNLWLPVPNSNGPSSVIWEGTGRYGIGYERISGSNTDIYVAFGNGGGSAYKGTAKTYGELNTDPWGGYTSAKWRVRKSSAGAAVGFGIVTPGVSSGLVSASGLPGNTTGSAIASGYVGEIVSGSPGVAVTPGASVASGINKTVTSISLSPGVWDVSGVVLFATGATLAGMSIMYCGISLTDNGNDTSSNLAVTGITTNNSLTSNLFLPCGPRRLVVTSTTTVYLVAGFNYSTLGGTTYGTASTIRATRIA